MNKQQILDMLSKLQISYKIIEHPPANTVEEIDAFHIADGDEIVKNLFLRDDKKKHYYLLVMQKDKKVDLKEIRMLLDSRPLSFASEEDLFSYLGLMKGAVTPFGILNDVSRKVEVIFDRDLHSFHGIGVHPNENTATVWLALADLANIINTHGNSIIYLTI